MSEPRKREFFTDRDLGLRFPAALTEAGLIVHRHDDHFTQDCRDEEWLTVVGQRGWVAITFDQRIRYKPNELSAVIDASVTLLVLVGRAKFPEQALSFIKTAPVILAFLDRHVPPLIAKVYRPTERALRLNGNARGRIELCYPPTDVN